MKASSWTSASLHERSSCLLVRQWKLMTETKDIRWCPLQIFEEDFPLCLGLSSLPCCVGQASNDFLTERRESKELSYNLHIRVNRLQEEEKVSEKTEK